MFVYKLENIDVNENQAQLVKIYVKNNDYIKKGDLLCSLETTKVIFDVEAQVSGYVEFFVKEGDKTKDVTVQFDVTANGSVVVEKMFPGTPMEMMTVYSENAQGQLEFTHYCTLGVHPRMELTQFDKNNFNFEFSKSNKIGKNEAHMHSLTVVFKDANNFTENWTFFQDGKKAKPTSFNFSRVS